MAVIYVDNPTPTSESSPKTSLTNNVLSGATSLPTLSSQGFTASRLVQVGDIGSDLSEIVSGTGISGNNFSCSTLTNNHPVGTNIYEVRYNQTKIYRTRSSVQSLVATINLQLDKLSTYYQDTAAQTGDTYQFSYFNSLTGDESPKSASLAQTAFGDNTLRRMRERAKTLFRDKNEKQVFAEDWNAWCNEALAELQRAIMKKDEKYSLISSTLTAAGTSEDGVGTIYVLPTDFRVLKAIWCQFGGVWRPATEIDWSAIYPGLQQSFTAPLYTFEGDNIIVRPMNPQSVRIFYYPSFTKLVNDADTPQKPMDSYDTCIVDYMVMRAYLTSQNDNMVGQYAAKYKVEKEDMISEVALRQFDTNDGVIIRDEFWASIYGDTYD